MSVIRLIALAVLGAAATRWGLRQHPLQQHRVAATRDVPGASVEMYAPSSSGGLPPPWCF
jgi:hypothetical protein